LGGLTITVEDFEANHLTKQFYDALRGFIVLEESGLPKYIEFLTVEQIDVVLLAGLLSGLQALAEVISEENIKTIETTNSTFLFEAQDEYFYVFWIEKTLTNLDYYHDIITKLIARFVGASKTNVSNTLLISNLTETPDYEKFGQRILKFRSMDKQYSEAYRRIMAESNATEEIKQLTKQLAGIDGVMVITEDGVLEYSEFSRGSAFFNLDILTNFLVGLRKSIKNLDPGNLREITTQNYRFIIHDREDYFYVFEVIKGLADEAELDAIQHKIISRYEGVRKRGLSVKLLQNLDTVTEYELLGQLSLEMKREQDKRVKQQASLKRQTSRLSFGDTESKWYREEAQLHAFMDVYPEVILTGIVTPGNRFFCMKKVPDSNDWIALAKNLELSELLELTVRTKQNELVKLRKNNRPMLLKRITDQTVLIAVVENDNAELEHYMVRLPLILRKISANLT